MRLLRNNSQRRGLLAAGVLVAGLLGVSGCQSYEVRTYKNAMLANLPGAQTGESENIRHVRTGKALDPTATPTVGIRVEDERGNITLYSRSLRHLMVHLHTTLADEERELFVEQVLSERTKQEFAERGLDPGMAFDELKLRERDVLRFFSTIPFAENTPGTGLEQLSPNTFRMRAPGGRGSTLRYAFIDVVVEGGEWKLRWFGR